MKKILALVCITALLCGCSDKNNSKSSSGGSAANNQASGNNAATEATTDDIIPEATGEQGIDTSYEAPVIGNEIDMSNVENVSWSSLYRSALNDFKKSENFSEAARFSIYDINDDKIPELIISYGSSDDKTYLIRSLNIDNTYTEFEPITKCGDLLYGMKRSLLATYKYDYENQVQDVQIYRLKNSKLANVYTFQMTSNECKVNGQVVSDDQYNEEYNNLFDGFIKSMGTDHSFDDDIINAALGEMDDWKEAFCAVLTDYLKYKKKYDNNFYSLMDINGDEIPELFVSGGAPYAPYVDVYAWNGCPVPVGSFGTDGTILYYPEKNLLLTEYDNPSYSAGSFYSFNNVYKFEAGISYGNNENSKKQDENVTVVYKINGEETDKSTYEKTVKESKKGKAYVLGLDNDVTEENIKALKEGKYTKPSEKK